VTGKGLGGPGGLSPREPVTRLAVGVAVLSAAAVVRAPGGEG